MVFAFRLSCMFALTFVWFGFGQAEGEVYSHPMGFFFQCGVQGMNSQYRKLVLLMFSYLFIYFRSHYGSICWNVECTDSVLFLFVCHAVFSNRILHTLLIVYKQFCGSVRDHDFVRCTGFLDSQECEWEAIGGAPVVERYQRGRWKCVALWISWSAGLYPQQASRYYLEIGLLLTPRFVVFNDKFNQSYYEKYNSNGTTSYITGISERTLHVLIKTKNKFEQKKLHIKPNQNC